MNIFIMIGLACVTILFTESTPMKTIKDKLGILNPNQSMSIIKYRLIEFINCNMCSGFVIGILYNIIVGNNTEMTILSSAVISILSELINKQLRK